MRSAALVVVASILASACASAPAAVCTHPVTIDPKRREVRTEEWLTLLLRGADRDCRGTKIEVVELPEKCSAVAEAGAPEPLRSLGDDDLVIHRVDKTRRLVWVITRRLSNGDGVGPVALAELGPEGIQVVALGTLRAKTEGAKLRLHPVGEGRKAGEIVTIEGGNCSGSAEDDCRRSLVVSARRSTALTAEHLEDSRGRCIGPSKIDLSRKMVTNAANGWKREFELTATATYLPEGIRIHEVVTVKEFDPKQRDATINEVRRAEGDRLVKWVDGLLVVTEEPLWDRMTR